MQTGIPDYPLCEHLKHGKYVTVYYATDNVSEAISRGYVGYDRPIYCSLSPIDLCRVVIGRGVMREGRILHFHDPGIFEIKHADIDWFYADFEPWEFVEIPQTWSRSSRETILRLRKNGLGSGVTLRDMHIVCEDCYRNVPRNLRYKRDAFAENVWMILPERVAKFPTSETNLISRCLEHVR